MYFKIPNLDKNSILSQQDGFAIYNHYLNTEQEDSEGNKRKPTKTAIVTAMNNHHNAKPHNLIQKWLDAGKRVLFWSDQHFGHNNIISYSERPFDDKNHMNNSMMTNYFSAVKEEDLVVWGGDVSFSSVAESKQMFNTLPGTKILIMGNHDFDRKYIFKNYGIFSDIYMAKVFHMKFDDKICNLLVTHYPIDNKFLPPNTLNIHGHIHNKTADYKNINISVECVDYRPTDISEIIKEKFITIKE